MTERESNQAVNRRICNTCRKKRWHHQPGKEAERCVFQPTARYEAQGVRASQSFSPDEVNALAQILETVQRRGDATAIMRTRAGQAVASKARVMAERTAVLKEVRRRAEAQKDAAE